MQKILKNKEFIMKKIKIILPLIILVASAFILHFAYGSQIGIAARLSGKILLQVENKGEAWYVNPSDQRRYYMGSPADAFNLMRSAGIGITDANLNKIRVADLNLAASLDSDGDGLSDAIESAFGTNPNNKDTDGDGFDDKTEILAGYNPLGSGSLPLDANFAKAQAGRIFLQVEKKGEAWYVNPDNNLRYYLGSPADAFAVMRSLGLGITNNDLGKIIVGFGVPAPSKPAAGEPVDAGSSGGTSGILNCGISPAYQEKTYRQDSSGEYYEILQYDRDNALVCMGKALTNNCQPARILRTIATGVSRTEEIIGKEGNNCLLKIEYKTITENDSPEKIYENSVMQCSYPQSFISSGCYMIPEGICDELELKGSPGHVYAYTFQEFWQSARFDSDALSCSGSMVDRIKN